MKKMGLALLLASGLMASDDGVYLGADLGNTKADFKMFIHDPNINFSKKDDGGSQTLKVGYYFNSNNRIAAFYQNINIEDGNGDISGIGYDYLIGDHELKPFAGVMAGYGSMDDDYFGFDISGAFIGAQLGINYAFNDNISIEAGYRYMKTNMNDTVAVIVIDLGEIRDLDIEIDTLKNWFIGANYKF